MDVQAESPGRPGDNFVSLPFNLVVLIALGLISAHSRRFACLICFCAIFIHLRSTAEQKAVYSAATWKHLPAAKVTQSDVSDFLIFGLVRWISSFIFGASVCRVICRLVPNADVVAIVRGTWFTTLLVCGAVLFRGGSEYDTLRLVTGDWGIYYHFWSAQVMESIRAAFQG